MSPAAPHLNRLPDRYRSTGATPAAFTLIELLVVVVILSILASLSLAGLAATRQRSKADKTRSTIRKIDAVIRPMYDSYRTRRVTLSGSSGSNVVNASNLLVAKRGLMAREMPDSWDDVPPTLALFNALPETQKTSASLRSYTSLRSSLAASPVAVNDSPECLYLIVSRSGFEPDALELFRGDEVADTDNDGAKEFSDGWGNPITFMRWAPGLTGSPIQRNDPTASHDPLDPLNIDASAFALVPTICSAGPDNAYGIVTMSGTTGSGTVRGWAQLNLASICSLTVSGASIAAWNGLKAGVADPTNAADAIDNITNHDLSRR
jgi:prepilin-type N-terminal cleavage/methylation domain-containing protein